MWNPKEKWLPEAGWRVGKSNKCGKKKSGHFQLFNK